MIRDLAIFSGSSHPKFTADVAARLYTDNLMPQIMENVRGKEAFVIQTSCPPVHDKLMELLIYIDTLKHASARRITAVIPYFPYVRSDKKDQPRISITAKLVAKMIETAGADRVLVMDLHASQIQGFFNIPCDHLRAVDVLCKCVKDLKLSPEEAVLVAADAGEAKHIGSFANRLGFQFAIVDKRRIGNEDKTKPVGVVGEVEGKRTIIVDDEISTGGTLVTTAEFLMQNGAKDVIAIATHGVFCGEACQRIENSSLSAVYVTDTIPPCEPTSSKIHYASVASLFAEAIRCIHTGESISHIFSPGWENR